MLMKRGKKNDDDPEEEEEEEEGIQDQEPVWRYCGLNGGLGVAAVREGTWVESAVCPISVAEAAVWDRLPQGGPRRPEPFNVGSGVSRRAGTVPPAGAKCGEGEGGVRGKKVLVRAPALSQTRQTWMWPLGLRRWADGRALEGDGKGETARLFALSSRSPRPEEYKDERKGGGFHF